MKKREAPPVRLQAAVQVRPSVYFMYGLVADQLLEQKRRSLPADSLQAEKATVEPRFEEMLEIGIKRREFRSVRGFRKKVFTEGHQSSRALRRRIDAPNQLLARRLHGFEKHCKSLGAGCLLVIGCCTVD